MAVPSTLGFGVSCGPQGLCGTSEDGYGRACAADGEGCAFHGIRFDDGSEGASLVDFLLNSLIACLLIALKLCD